MDVPSKSGYEQIEEVPSARTTLLITELLNDLEILRSVRLRPLTMTIT